MFCKYKASEIVQMINPFHLCFLITCVLFYFVFVLRKQENHQAGPYSQSSNRKRDQISAGNRHRSSYTFSKKWREKERKESFGSKNPGMCPLFELSSDSEGKEIPWKKWTMQLLFSIYSQTSHLSRCGSHTSYNSPVNKFVTDGIVIWDIWRGTM